MWYNVTERGTLTYIVVILWPDDRTNIMWTMWNLNNFLCSYYTDFTVKDPDSVQSKISEYRLYKSLQLFHCGQSITAFSVRLMFATVRLFKKSHVSPFIAQKRLLFVIFKPFLSSVSFIDV